MNQSKTFSFSRANGLLAHGQVQRSNFKVIGTFSRIQRLFMLALRIVLKILGPDRYYMFLRYLAHISSILNQNKMFTVKK